MNLNTDQFLNYFVMHINKHLNAGIYFDYVFFLSYLYSTHYVALLWMHFPLASIIYTTQMNLCYQ